MVYRGRLLFPFIARLARLDTSASTYDQDFRTVTHSYPTGQAGARVSTRAELPVVELSCQVEDSRWEVQRQTATGNAPDSEIILVFHFSELESKGLVDVASGDAMIRTGDRLVDLRSSKTGALVQASAKPNLFVTEARPGGFGLGLSRNLLIVSFAERSQGPTT